MSKELAQKALDPKVLDVLDDQEAFLEKEKERKASEGSEKCVKFSDKDIEAIEKLFKKIKATLSNRSPKVDSKIRLDKPNNTYILESNDGKPLLTVDLKEPNKIHVDTSSDDSLKAVAALIAEELNSGSGFQPTVIGFSEAEKEKLENELLLAGVDLTKVKYKSMEEHKSGKEGEPIKPKISEQEETSRNSLSPFNKTPLKVG